MTYNELLSSYIKNSGLTLRKISNECEQIGISVDPSYISKLQTGKMPPPSEEISRALARVCGGDINKLVTLGYIGKAPIQVQDALNEYISRWDSLVSFVYDDAKDNNLINLTEEEFKNKLNSLPIEQQFDFILSMFQHASYFILQSNNKSENILTKFGEKFLSSETKKNILRIPVYKLTDKSNELQELGFKWVSSHDTPRISCDYFYLFVSSDYVTNDFIPRNSHLLIERLNENDELTLNNLKNGDLVLVCYNDEDLFARYYLEDDIIILQNNPQNSAPIIVKSSDRDTLNIWGKVIKIEFNPNES
ncbi:hypothetical protein EXM69_20475 [Clostridium botulinum]|uniref:Uncharacterized protein n=1 Tax=Clostridium botulinum TaxID=1491 RepID=A0A846I3L8_CLOBO|nr:hypothetical protein [Clostridium botulinum]